MSEKDAANYLDVSEAEIDEIMASVPTIQGKGPSDLISGLRDKVRQTLVANRNPVTRLNRSIMEKYEVTDRYEVKFGRSKEGKRDNSIYLMNHSFNTAVSHLEMIATDNNLSSVDVQRYTADRSKSPIFTPGQVAGNCLESIQRYHKDIEDPSDNLKREIAEKYGVNEDGFIQFNNSEDGKRDLDICLVIHAFATAKLALELIARDSAKLSSSDVKRYTSGGTPIYTPSEVAATSLETIKQILKGDATSNTLA